MGVKRKNDRHDSGSEFDEGKQQKKKTVNKEKGEILPSLIKNKEKRSAVHAKLKHQKKVEKRKKIKARDAAEKRALELGEEVLPLPVFSPCLICYVFVFVSLPMADTIIVCT